MENEKIQKINSLDSKIRELNKEKEYIQGTCGHKNTKVKFEPGTNTMKLYCSECDKEIGYPNQDQIKEFLR
jgi:hypothetical protein